MQKRIDFTYKQFLIWIFILFAGLPTVSCKGSESSENNIVSKKDSIKTEETYQNPVEKENAPDPTVIKYQGVYYCYDGTTIYSSTDLIYWKYSGDAFANSPYPTWLKDGQIWAPDMKYINHQFVMYYAFSKWGEIYDNGIGIAVSDNPLGPFKDKGCLLVSKDIGVLNSIDPCYVEDANHKYLFWGSFNGIYATELTDDGFSIKKDTSGKPFLLKKVAGNAFEGTMIFKYKGYYYLFGSTGTCCEGMKSTYTTVVGRSMSLLGPYVNKEGKDMLNNGYEIVVHGSDLFKGTGHNSEIITDAKGQTWMLYHAWDVKDNIGRCLMLDQLVWNEGWPCVKDEVPSSGPTPGPVLH